ncbi:MAG: YkgJ family cysteine cluster protein [Planctomycetota bacterium]
MAESKNKFCWYIAGLCFECRECGNCCSGPEEGYIWVTKPEVELIAEFLKIPTRQLREKYLKRKGLRSTIIEQPITRDCIFLRKVNGQKRCMIYPVRPNQCRTWPFWPSNLSNPTEWNLAAKKCSGINRGKLYNYEQIEKIKRSKWWLDGG